MTTTQVPTSPYQLRIWHHSGVAIYDVATPAQGWTLWANMVKGGNSWWANSTTTVKVLLATAPL